jgi:hypothetical protein
MAGRPTSRAAGGCSARLPAWPASTRSRPTTRTVRRGRLLVELAAVLLAQADLDRRQAAWPAAAAQVEEVLGLAAPRRLRLHHTDGLVLRGRIRLDRAHADSTTDRRVTAGQALDAATFAASLARECGYLWGERDAEQLLGDAYTALGKRERARQHRRGGRRADQSPQHSSAALPSPAGATLTLSAAGRTPLGEADHNRPSLRQPPSPSAGP